MARYELRDKVALITGAARGIGFETARAIVARGGKVVIVDLDAETAAAAASEIGSGALGLAADVTDRGAMQQAVAEAVERFGGVDVVVANAGIASRGATFRAMSNESFDRVLAVNLHGVINTVEAALPEVVERQGHVVLIASIFAFVNGTGCAPYAIAKAGVEQFGRALRVELAQHEASASVAYFGFIDTEMVHSMLDADPLSDKLLDGIPAPLRKRLTPAIAGESIARGIERRSPRIIRPRRWIAFSVLRGIINPISDRQMESDEDLQAVVRQIDARAGEEQPTSA